MAKQYGSILCGKCDKLVNESQEMLLVYVVVLGTIKKSVRLAIEELQAWTCIRFQNVNEKYSGKFLAE